MWSMKERASVAECRAILGASADTMTDEEIETMRNELELTANVLFDQMVEGGREGLEAARWDSHFRETGEGDD
jgi:hypothetical protein